MQEGAWSDGRAFLETGWKGRVETKVLQVGDEGPEDSIWFRAAEVLSGGACMLFSGLYSELKFAISSFSNLGTNFRKGNAFYLHFFISWWRSTVCICGRAFKQVITAVNVCSQRKITH
jgi:hypothetical protein